jgi:hypothetical protein
MMKIKSVFLTAILCISGNLLAYSGDGDGSAGNPFQIANIYDFLQLCDSPTDWNKAFILTADINLSSLTFTDAPIAPYTGVNSGFQGTFNGNGHTLSNLTIAASTKDYIGLFGWVNRGGQITHLGVENIIITGQSYVGGLAGWNYSGTITDCHAAG